MNQSTLGLPTDNILDPPVSPPTSADGILEVTSWSCDDLLSCGIEWGAVNSTSTDPTKSGLAVYLSPVLAAGQMTSRAGFRLVSTIFQSGTVITGGVNLTTQFVAVWGAQTCVPGKTHIICVAKSIYNGFVVQTQKLDAVTGSLPT